MKTYERQIKGEGKAEDLTEAEVRQALEHNIKDIDVAIDALKDGCEINTAFAVYRCKDVNSGEPDTVLKETFEGMNKKYGKGAI